MTDFHRKEPQEILYGMLFILLILSFGRSSGKSSTLPGLWNNECFVLPSFFAIMIICHKPVIYIH